MKVILMHGKDATPNDKWYPWFGQQMEGKGIEYICPELPNTNAPKFEEWVGELAKIEPDEETVLIGHSRGGAAVMRWLETLPEDKKIKKVILVAANSGKISANLPPSDSKAGFYDDDGYDFEKIKTHCDDFVVFHSRDDQWVPFSHGEENADGLDARFMSYEDKGHFGKALGEFPELVKEVG